MIICLNPRRITLGDPLDVDIWWALNKRTPGLYQLSVRADRADAAHFFALVDQKMDWVSEAKRREAADTVSHIAKPPGI